MFSLLFNNFQKYKLFIRFKIRGSEFGSITRKSKLASTRGWCLRREEGRKEGWITSERYEKDQQAWLLVAYS